MKHQTKRKIEDCNPEEIKEILKQYEPNPEQDTDEMLILKNKIATLDTADRVILLLYAECQSQRQLGEMFGLSHSTIAKELKRIKKELGYGDAVDDKPSDGLYR